MTQLAAQTALVTGANGGLGREFVNQLLARGATKVYAGARNPETIDVNDPRVVPLQLDVTDPDSVARAAEVAGDVSLVVNNAGISLAARVLDDDTAKLRRELEVNLFGPLAVTSAFPDQLAARSGVVVNVASILAWIALGGSYSVSKAALGSATDSMRLELGPWASRSSGSTWATSTPTWRQGSKRRRARPRTSSARCSTASRAPPWRSRPMT